MSPISEFKITNIDGALTSLKDFEGKVLVIVNVASRCGFTPQYEGLEALYRRYKDQGLVVLGFPCNQFGQQEPGSDDEIKAFCRTTYDVTFPVFSRIEVNGDHTHPLYSYLKKEAKGLLGSEAIKWNFTKFLVDREGRVVRRYAPTDTPEKIGRDLETLLSTPSSPE